MFLSTIQYATCGDSYYEMYSEFSLAFNINMPAKLFQVQVGKLLLLSWVKALLRTSTVMLKRDHLWLRKSLSYKCGKLNGVSLCPCPALMPFPCTCYGPLHSQILMNSFVFKKPAPVGNEDWKFHPQVTIARIKTTNLAGTWWTLTEFQPDWHQKECLTLDFPIFPSISRARITADTTKNTVEIAS